LSNLIRPRKTLSRRRFLAASGATLALSQLGSLARPSLSRAADRPAVTHGIQSGDISNDSAVVWARADRPARMLVEASTTESFREIVCGTVTDVLPETDFTGKVLLQDLPAGQDIFYRIRFQDLSAPTILGEPAIGRLRTAPDERRSVSFVWSGDTCGQGWGIDEARGGYRTYAAMLREEPDFFIHSGDNIYADCINPPELDLPDGTVWTNLVTEEKSRAAETLADYRGNYKYNLLDRNVRAFNAQVPILAQWDDHEVTNDWWPGLPLERDLGYDATNAMLLAARGARAFREFVPMRETMAEPGRVYRKIAYGPLLDVFLLDMRSYRSANADTARTADPGSHFLGPRQVAWLKRELSRSRAVWKIIAADMPLGLILGGEAVAQGDGPPAGREFEIADLLSFMKRNAIRNTVWLTADVHYTAAHYYDPNAAVFQDFEPFWEFVSGPLHAGTWPACTLDNTFGPRVVYEKACNEEQGENLAPCFGLQFFGHVAIDGASAAMTVTLKDVSGAALWATVIEPRPAGRPASAEFRG
jgi:alkaline phosphatase D